MLDLLFDPIYRQVKKLTNTLALKQMYDYMIAIITTWNCCRSGTVVSLQKCHLDLVMDSGDFTVFLLVDPQLMKKVSITERYRWSQVICEFEKEKSND